MKKILSAALVIFSLALIGSIAIASDASIELGKKLFNDPELAGSGNDKSCSSCHPGGEGLKDAGTNKKLDRIINTCIAGPLQGKKLDADSVEMLSLKMYLESLK